MPFSIIIICAAAREALGKATKSTTSSSRTRVQKRKKKLVGLYRRKRDGKRPRRKGKMGKDEENYDESEVIYGEGEMGTAKRANSEKRSRTAFGKVKNLNGPLAVVIIAAVASFSLGQSVCIDHGEKLTCFRSASSRNRPHQIL
jgi:hypothetical protein